MNEDNISLLKKKQDNVTRNCMQQEIIIGPIIHPDGRSGFNGLAKYGYIHNTANDGGNFVYHLTNVHCRKSMFKIEKKCVVQFTNFC